MRSSLVLAMFGGLAVAQHLGDIIPEVESFVESILSEFQSYTSMLPANPTASHRTASSASPPAATASCDYWLADIKHQGVAAFNPSPSTYQVFRNVMDFGAKGDGVTDDTAAIQNAISSGGRLSPAAGGSTTVTPAIVYFPPGVYAISYSIIDYYYTQLIGNPNCVPTIRALSNFTGARGFGMIDGDQYQSTGQTGFGATNVFWRQIRNFIIDMTLVPASNAMTGIHWPTAQATSIQNVVFEMSDAPGTQHQGIFCESGSGGFMTDLVFNGGLYGAQFANQQFTMRNLTFNNVVTAINQLFDWGWLYEGIVINNCSVGISMTSGAPSASSVGSVLVIDSSFTNTKTGILSAQPGAQPPTSNSLILENVQFSNVGTAVQGSSGALLAGGTFVANWGQGNEYTPTGPTSFRGPITPNSRPASLVQAGGKYYQRSKPQYQQYPVSSFISARSQGATGDGHTDDTVALQAAILLAKAQNKILFVDQGDYLVSATLYIPSGSRIVGESYSVILSHGSFFNNINFPQPVVRIGLPGEGGSIEWSDMIVSTQGQQRGAILIEFNLASPSNSPSGIWDVHARIGGFAGSNLQVAQCPKTPTVTVTAANLNTNCIAAFLTMHLTTFSSGLYLENVWLWTADHDVEDPALTQITVYAGRGLLQESAAGTFWFVGTAVEHHTLYQYQFANTKNVFAGFIQTETPYYQPNPSAPTPWPYNSFYNDPTFPTQTVQADGLVIPDADAWGLRIINSNAILVYGAGLYSFFNNYSTTCSNQGNGEQCQYQMLDVEHSSGVSVYTYSTVGVHEMLTLNGQVVSNSSYAQNLDGFVDTIALFRTG